MLDNYIMVNKFNVKFLLILTNSSLTILPSFQLLLKNTEAFYCTCYERFGEMLVFVKGLCMVMLIMPKKCLNGYRLIRKSILTTKMGCTSCSCRSKGI